MDWSSLFPRELMQYPDKKLYQAASALEPAERPTVPVRLTDDYRKQYVELGGGVKMSGAAEPEGFTTPDQSMIYVNKRLPSYSDKGRLMAILGHEAYHASDMSKDHPATREVKAREREVGILGRQKGQQYTDLANTIRQRYGIK